MIGNVERKLEAREDCESHQTSVQMKEKRKESKLTGRVLNCSAVLRKLGKTKDTYQRSLASLRKRPTLGSFLHSVKGATCGNHGCWVNARLFKWSINYASHSQRSENSIFMAATVRLRTLQLYFSTWHQGADPL